MKSLQAEIYSKVAGAAVIGHYAKELAIERIDAVVSPRVWDGVLWGMANVGMAVERVSSRVEVSRTEWGLVGRSLTRGLDSRDYSRYREVLDHAVEWGMPERVAEDKLDSMANCLGVEDRY
jgi:hypothetical protein